MDNQERLEDPETVDAKNPPSLWYIRPDPGEYAFAHDQQPPSPQKFLAFKTALFTNEAHRTERCLPLVANLPCFQELRTPTLMPSWPLSWFQEDTNLPTDAEMKTFQSICLQRWGPQCSILLTLDHQERTMVRPPVGAAIASLGGTLADSNHSKDIWFHTNRMLLVVFALNNRMTRSHYAYVAWMLNDVAAVMSTDPEVRRLANVTHGMIKAAMRRRWQAQQIETNTVQHGPALESLLPCLLQTDLVRSLRMQTIPTTISAFGSIPLTVASKSTLQDLATTVFDDNDTDWTFESQEVAFLKLLVILNEVVIHALVYRGLERETPAIVPSIMSFSTSGEIKRLRRQIENALLRWHTVCFSQVGLEVQALFHFCSLYILALDLHRLPQDAKHSRTGQDLAETNAEQMSGFAPRLDRAHCPKTPDWREGGCSPAETAHHAWLVYESVSRIPPDDPALFTLHLPMITFLAGLYVWQNIKKHGSSRIHGSTRVLKLFSYELRRMSWPCCSEMADLLASLAG